MVEDGRASADDAGEPDPENETGTGWWDVGIDSIEATTEALAAANDAHALSIDPQVVDSMVRKLSTIQDELMTDVVMMSFHLTTDSPLGGGYAAQVGEVNGKIAAQALGTVIPRMTRAIDDLKTEIERSRAHYRNTDATNEVELDRIRGRVQP